MATKCATEVTVLDQTDATAVRCWYQMSASATLPAKPATTDASATPPGWARSEPGISSDEDAAKYVYACWQTVWGDGTCDWGDVSMSASFEAAKRAWNLAQGTSQELANLSIGGANLLTHDTVAWGRLTVDGEPYTSGEGGQHMHSEPIPVNGGESYVLSWFYKADAYSTSYLYVNWFDENNAHISKSPENAANIYNDEPSFYKIVAPSNATYAIVSMPSVLASRCAVKFEKGAVPTDLSLSVRDATNQPNVLRGTNQPNVLRELTASCHWEDGLWRESSGNATNGSAEIIEITDCPDPTQRYGFRVWSTTSGNKDAGQIAIPYDYGKNYRIGGFVRLTHNEENPQTSATLQFRIYASSALKTYTLAVKSEEWVRFTYAFSLSQAQAELNLLTLIGVKGKGSLEYCGLYLHKGYVALRKVLGEEYLPWQPATEDYASYGSTNNAIAETSANAVKRTQRIYYRTQSTTAPTSEFMPTAWVTETGDRWAADAATLSNWTTKVTPISDGTAKYLRLYTCEQREMGDGTLLYTNVLLDDSTTVIDGGNIITGSVAANRIDAASGTFSTANIPALTADHIKANVIDAVNGGTGKINADKINVNAISIGDLDGADDYATKQDAAQFSQANLTPYFSMPQSDVYNATSNQNGYWKRVVDNSQFTTYEMQVEHSGSGGWVHFAGSVSSGSPYVRFEPVPIATLKPSTDYTFMVEVDIVNAASTLTGITLNLCEGDLNTDAIDPFSERTRSYLKSVEGVSCYTVRTRASLSDVTVLSRSYLQLSGTGEFDIYLRISLYEGAYSGLYKPYVDQSLQDRISGVQANLDAESAARKAVYGTCSTAAGTAAKVVSCDGFDPYEGARLIVRFTTANTHNAPTLNVVDAYGATIVTGPVWNRGAVASANNTVRWGVSTSGPNVTLHFIWDGTHFNLDMKAPSYSSACSTAAGTRDKVVSFQDALIVNGTTVSVEFSNANTYKANSVRLNCAGTGALPIHRNGAVTSTTNTLLWDAGTVLTFVMKNAEWNLMDNGTRTMAEDAAKTATNYVTAIEGNGIWVTPSDAKPDASGDEVAGTTSGWHIANALDLFRKGVSMFKVWVDETTSATMTRIGQEAGKHLLLDDDGISLVNASAIMARIQQVTNMTDITGRLAFHDGAYIHGGNKRGNVAAIEMVADHGQDGDTSRYGHKAFVAVDSWCDSANGEAGSTVCLSGDELELADSDHAISSVPMMRVLDHVSGGRELFTGTYSNTRASVVTLSESAANFSMLRIICEDGDGQQTSTDVYVPDGKKFTVTMSTATDAYMYIKTKTFVINGTSIGCQQVTGTNSYYRHGQARIGSDGTVYSQNAELIGIVRVIGFY